MSFVIVRDVFEATGPERALQMAAEAAALEVTISTRVEQEIERLRYQAEAAGRAKGEAEARIAAQAEQVAQEVAVNAAVSAFGSAWAQLTAPLAQKEKELAELITEFAFMLARHVIGVEVTLNAEGVKMLVDALLTEAARERGAQQSIVIRLNPADHAVLEPYMRIDHAHMLADTHITRGGTVIELIAPGGDPIDKVEWDAQIETRLETMRAALTLGDDALLRSKAA